MPIISVFGCRVDRAATVCSVCWLVCANVAVVCGSLAVNKRTTFWTCILSICRCTGALIIAVIACSTALILLGASIQTARSRTLEFAMLLAAVVVPATTVIHLDAAGFRRLLQMCRLSAERPAERIASYSAAGAVIGAWFGTVAIPLDWNVWWQQWPVPCELALVGGHSIGLFIALYGLKRDKSPAHQM